VKTGEEPADSAEVVDRLLRTGVALAVAGVAIQTLVHVVNLFVLDDRYYHLDVSAEKTVFAWASSAATFAAACASLLIAAIPQTKRRLWMLILGLLLAQLSLDDFVEIHERLGVEVDDLLDLPEFIGPRVWVVVYFPLLVVAAALLVWSALESPPRPSRYQLAGLGLLVLGVASEALGVFTKLLEEHGIESPHRLRAGLEEGLELGGWILIAAALTAAFYVRRLNGTARSLDR
jgi:hypothetical protein